MPSKAIQNNFPSPGKKQNPDCCKQSGVFYVQRYRY
nr:MAG TPA: hypothetical protein [Caudoviricetes sp.]